MNPNRSGRCDEKNAETVEQKEYIYRAEVAVYYSEKFIDTMVFNSEDKFRVRSSRGTNYLSAKYLHLETSAPIRIIRQYRVVKE